MRREWGRRRERRPVHAPSPALVEAFLLDLIANRVPPGVDDASYAKADFLAAVPPPGATHPGTAGHARPIHEEGLMRDEESFVQEIRGLRFAWEKSTP